MKTFWHPTRTTIHAVLDGVHEHATGTAAITLERVNRRICFKLAWSGIGSPVTAHIHEVGGGCAVLPLFVDTPKRQGCVKADKSLIKKITKTPGNYYVKLPTQRHPDGALLAQF